jgi:hypothetical protein
MNAILGFKNLEGEDRENCPCGEELSEHLSIFHNKLMSYVSLSALQEPEESEVRISVCLPLSIFLPVRDIQICLVCCQE